MKQIFIIELVLSCCYSFSMYAQSTEPQAVMSPDAPKVIAPYSQAVAWQGLVFCAGQLGISPATGSLAGNDINAQTEQALKNIKAVVEASGSDMEHVLKVTVYLKNIKDYAAMNEIYKTYFPGLKPARSTVEVSNLPKDALVEIEVIAAKKSGN